jgi:hypothetical protein
LITCLTRGDAAVSRRYVARRDDVGALLEGDGVEDTTMDGDGDNTGDAGDRYRGALQFGTTFAEASRGQCLDERLAEEEPDVGQEPRDDDEWSGRRGQRELAELVAGGDGSHSRTDPDLLGHGDYDSGLSAEEAAMHLMYKPPGS